MHRSSRSSEGYPVLAIDGVPIAQWLKSKLPDLADEDTIGNLVPAQGWLLDDKDLEIAWELLNPMSSRELLVPEADVSTIVPILICPDDMDYNCTAIAVEQVVNLETV